MNPKVSLSRMFAALGSFGLCVALSGDAAAQPLPPDAPAPPPPTYVATVEPVYYEGHAAYWFANHWYWRDPHGWHWYASEPGFLRDRRSHGPPPRHHYERRR
jgi:hypothetical protein